MARHENQQISMRELYDDLNTEQLADAEANLRRYLGVVKRIFDHIQAENPKILTDLRRRAKLRKEKVHK